MRSRWQTQYSIIGSASLFHNSVRVILAESPSFKNLKCFQEVPVVDLVPHYPNPTHRVDWYIEPYRAVIELHGEQHYKMVNFGGVGYDLATQNFKDAQRRDRQKKTYLLEGGYLYVEIPFTMSGKLDTTSLLELIQNGEEIETS